MARRSGRTTKMLLHLAQYITDNWDEEKQVIIAAHNIAYATDILMQLKTFFPSAKRFAYTSVQFGKVTVRPFCFSDLERPEVMHGCNWDQIFENHYVPWEDYA